MRALFLPGPAVRAGRGRDTPTLSNPHVPQLPLPSMSLQWMADEKNIETLSMKQFKKTLAADVSMDWSAFKKILKKNKDYNSIVEDFVHQIIVRYQRDQDEPEPAPEDEPYPDQNDRPESDSAVGQKRRKKSTTTAATTANKRSKASLKIEQAAVRANEARARAALHEVGRLKQTCRLATIPIPPRIYSLAAGDTTTLAGLLVDLLRTHGLQASSCPKEVRAVRAKLTKQRDLDGIDAANVLTTGGRRAPGGAEEGRRRLRRAASDYEDVDVGVEDAGPGLVFDLEDEDVGGAGEEGEPTPSPPGPRPRVEGGRGDVLVASQRRLVDDSDDEW